MKIYQVTAGISLFCLSLAIAVTVPTMARDEHIRMPKRENPVTPTTQELRSYTLKDGTKWAVVKVWGYKYSPVPPNFDLEVLNQALNSNEYSLVIAESEDTPPVWGWYYKKDLTGVWQQLPITPQFVTENPEIFEANR